MSTPGRPEGESRSAQAGSVSDHSAPRLAGDAADEAAPASPPLLAVEGLVKHYTLPRERLLGAAPVVRALEGIDFTLAEGHSLGVVGESGSGKSTLARLVMALEPPSAGRVVFDGQDLNALDAAALRRARVGFQMVFQDPFASLDPRLKVGRIVAEPLAAQGIGGRRGSGADVQARVAEMLSAVGLRPADAQKYPHEFSGGQRQRIAIARALVTHPRLIVADEPVSALDVSVQAQVLNLMQDLQERLGVTYLFISHDLAVVDLVCDEVLVLYQGRVVEQGSPATLFGEAAHPYTRALIDAVPRMRPRPARLAGPPGPGPLPAVADAMPDPGQAKAAGEGCAFAPRCGFRSAECLARRPLLLPFGAPGADGHSRHRVACHHAPQVMAQGPALS